MHPGSVFFQTSKVTGVFPVVFLACLAVFVRSINIHPVTAIFRKTPKFNVKKFFQKFNNPLLLSKLTQSLQKSSLPDDGPFTL
jgi:maltodextrin utilization protein YvdJ